MRLAILSIALMSALCFGKGASKKELLPKQLLGTIPEFQVLTIENEPGPSSDDLKEKARKAGAKRIVLSFFQTTCKNCMEEFKLLSKKTKELEKNGVQVYLIDVGESIHKMGDKVSKMVKEFAGSSFPFYFDPDGILLEDFGLTNADGAKLPMTIILDIDLRVLGILSAVSKDDYPQILWGEL